MPNDVSTGYNTGRVNLSDAPGADMDWDSLFPNPELHPATQPQAATGTTPQPEPQATNDYLRSSDGSIIYKTAEDAIKGLDHKNSEIAKYRSFLKDNGIDPNTMQRTATQPQAVQQPQSTQTRFFDRIAEAATKGDKDGYETAMRDFFLNLVDPYKPALAEVNRFKAYQQVAREVPGFKEFYDNGGYAETLERNPLFRDMNQIGENDPNAAARLPELYRSAFFYYRGTQPPPQATTSSTQTNPTVRQQQSLQPSTLTPPAPTGNTAGWQEANWRGNKSLGNDARKTLIQDGDKKFQGMRFEDLGL